VKPPAPSLTGARVRWKGPYSSRLITTAFQDAFRAGDRRLPRDDEVHDLAEGDEGTVGELLYVDRAGANYVIAWDAGTEMEINLPCALVTILGDEERVSTHDRPGRGGRPGRWVAEVIRRLRRAVPSRRPR